MRVVRATGETIAPSDDAKLYERLFTDGLFEDATITSLGSNQVSIPALYGIMQGREFTTDADTFSVELPSSESTGYILVTYDTTTDEVGSITCQLTPYTPTYEDINDTGTVCEMIIAEYTADATSVSDITMVYSLACATDSYIGGDTISSGSDSHTISNDNITADSLITIWIAEDDKETWSDAEPSFTQSAGSLVITFDSSTAADIVIENIHVVNV